MMILDAISYLKVRIKDWNVHPLKGEYLHVRCCAHILNLVVNNGLKDLHVSINKIRNVVRFVRVSPVEWNLRIWDHARVFVRFLNFLYYVTNKVLGFLYVTSILHEFNTLKTLTNSLDPLLGSMTGKMKSNHDKYWRNIKTINMVAFIVSMWDLDFFQYKLQFVEWSFEEVYDKEDAEFLSGRVKETFNKMFNRYGFFHENSETQSTQTLRKMKTYNTTIVDTSFTKEFKKDINKGKAVNKNEVNLYLMDTLEKTTKTFDILNWWKVNSSKYHTLGQIAKDVLVICALTIASKYEI
uniref:AC9 transposase n=1 Tax=Cajanus cajan TaxID=3821 RepID=A0A151R2X9_CAJCA|nr:Putative AC9 transposase [Cajanus cajan]